MTSRYPSLADRFWSRVSVAKGCWLWTGSRFPFGHGAISKNGRNTRAHRVSWELHFGPIPEGMHVLHTCDNPPCVNPAHLYLGTNRENTADRDRRRRQVNSKKTHCKRGHPLVGDNLKLKPSGYRQCRICERERDNTYRVNRRARLAGGAA